MGRLLVLGFAADGGPVTESRFARLTGLIAGCESVAVGFWTAQDWRPDPERGRGRWVGPADISFPRRAHQRGHLLVLLAHWRWRWVATGRLLGAGQLARR